MKNTKLKKINKWMTKYQSGLIILIAVLYFMVGVVTGDILEDKGYDIDFSAGISMCPEIGVIGITLNKIKNLDLNGGDVVTYTYETTKKTYYIQHRIINIEDDYFEIKGDNVIGDWSHWVKEEDIKSKLIYSLDFVRCSWGDYIGVNV